MVPGKRITLADGKQYVIPPLSFRDVRELDEAGTSKQMADPGAGARANAIGAFVYIHRALAKNHPDVKIEDMEALLDPGLVAGILPIVLGKLALEERVSDPPAVK